MKNKSAFSPDITNYLRLENRFCSDTIIGEAITEFTCRKRWNKVS